MRIYSLLLVAVLIAGCTSTDVKQQTFIDQAMIVSWTEVTCIGDNDGISYIHFMYQEEGTLKFINGISTCRKLAGVRPVMGELTTIVFYDGKPIRLTRESGEILDVEIDLRSKNFLRKPINPIDPPVAIPFNPHPDIAMEECRHINMDVEHAACISYQAADQRKSSLCEEISRPGEDNERDICRQWVERLVDTF